MQRTLKFFEWKSSLWSSKASLEPDQSSSSALREGLIAYASRQADIFMSLHNRFQSLWQGLEVLDGASDQPAPVSAQFDEAMQGVEGGDAHLG